MRVRVNQAVPEEEVEETAHQRGRNLISLRLGPRRRLFNSLPHHPMTDQDALGAKLRNQLGNDPAGKLGGNRHEARLILRLRAVIQLGFQIAENLLTISR